MRVHTLEPTRLFLCASYLLLLSAQNECHGEDFSSGKSLTLELVLVLWSKLLCLWGVTRILFLLKVKNVGRHGGFGLQLDECYFFSSFFLR